MAKRHHNKILQLGIAVAFAALISGCALFSPTVSHDYLIPNAEGETTTVRITRSTNGTMEVLSENGPIVGEERRQILSQVWLPAAFDFPGVPFSTSMGNPNTGIRPVSP